MKNRVFTIRLNAAEHEALKTEAKAQRSTVAGLIRTYMNEGLAGFDRKHQNLVELLRGMDNELRLIKSLSATTVGAVALLKSARHDESQIVEVKTNLEKSFELEPAIEKLLDQSQKKAMKGSR